MKKAAGRETDRAAIDHRRRLEVERRRGIVRRYVALEQATGEDDAAYAAELGMSVDRLIRMASTMRRHGSDAPIPGDRVRTTATMRAGALKALDAEPDLGEIPPANRPQVRRRLSAIRGYLRLEKPTAADLVDAAREAGLHQQRFRTMLRSWILLREVSGIPGARPVQKKARKRPDDRDRSGRFMEQALTELGESARGKEIHERVVELCEAVGAIPPSAPLSYARLRVRRPTAERSRSK